MGNFPRIDDAMYSNDTYMALIFKVHMSVINTGSIYTEANYQLRVIAANAANGNSVKHERE